MALHDSLRRLREVVSNRRGGTTMATVLIRDVWELLYHFDGLDRKAREDWAKAHPEETSG